MKFCIFLAASVCLVFWGIVAPPSSAPLESVAHGTHYFYSTDFVESPYITNTTDLGFSYIYETHTSNAKKVRSLFNRIDGESIVFDSPVPTKKILDTLGARVVTTSGFGVFAYTPKKSHYIVENGRKINLQIVQRDNITHIGWPVILGSY